MLLYDLTMDSPGNRPDEAFERLLQRSVDLHEAIATHLGGAEFDYSPRSKTSMGMCSLSLEHARGVHALMAIGCPSSAVGLARLQFESVARGMWLLYAASDTDIDKLGAILTPETEKSARSLPLVGEMIKQIGKVAGSRAPAVAHQMLVHFRDVSWSALNSYVHAGMHPLRRHMDGFPAPIALGVLRNSNGLSTMAAMVLAVLTGDTRFTKPIGEIQRGFADCLPDLLQ